MPPSMVPWIAIVHAIFVARDEAGVGVERDPRRIVAERHLHLLDRAARSDQHRCEEVPEIVERDRVSPAGVLACTVEVVAPTDGVSTCGSQTPTAGLATISLSSMARAKVAPTCRPTMRMVLGARALLSSEISAWTSPWWMLAIGRSPNLSFA
jgi:hypothetical protein